MHNNHGIAVKGAAALASLVTAGLLMSCGLAAGQDGGTSRSAPRSAASTADADVAPRDNGWRARIRVGTTRAGAGLAGHEPRITTSGAPRLDRVASDTAGSQDEAVVVEVPRRVGVTFPRYEGGTLPTVAPPKYKEGTTPAVKHDSSQVVVDLGRSGSVTPPSVRQGKSGKLTPPGIVVD